MPIRGIPRTKSVVVLACVLLPGCLLTCGSSAFRPKRDSHRTAGGESRFRTVSIAELCGSPVEREARQALELPPCDAAGLHYARARVESHDVLVVAVDEPVGSWLVVDGVPRADDAIDAIERLGLSDLDEATEAGVLSAAILAAHPEAFVRRDLFATNPSEDEALARHVDIDSATLRSTSSGYWPAQHLARITTAAPSLAVAGCPLRTLTARLEGGRVTLTASCRGGSGLGSR